MSHPAPAPAPSVHGDSPGSADLDRLFTLAAGRELPTDAREALAERLAEPDSAGGRLTEWVVLHTCHRVELIGVARDAAGLPALSGSALLRGVEAVDHLLRVAAGLDSAVLAEEQVLGQVRDAYAAALARRQTGPVLNELLRRAIRVGKRSRAMALPGADRSLAQVALRWAADRALGKRALLLGTGTIARELASGMAAQGLTVHVASRRRDRAEKLVAALPGRGHAAIAADDALARGPWSLIAAATRTRTPLLSAGDLPRLGEALVIDLCAPPAVAPDLAGRLDGRLLDLDRLAHDGADPRSAALSPAAVRRLARELRDERDGFVRWLAERANGDAVAILRREADALRERHLDRLRRRGIVDDRQLAAADHMARAMLAELLHGPTLRLREGGLSAEQVSRLFALDP